MTQQEKYRASLYTATEVLHKTEYVLVEKVVSSLDGGEYVRKTYPADKREIFYRIAQLDHSHIPHIIDVFFDADTVVIEEYIPGKTLEKLMEEKHSFTAAEIRTVMKGLIAAIDTLHSHGMIHRDIKPANIMIRPNGEAVLIDYSIARVFLRGEDTQHLGTVGYAAPEQFGFSKSDQRTDLYAFGMTMRQIITKKNAPRYLRRAMKRCVEFDPSRRFRDMGQLVRKLRTDRWLRVAGAVLVAAALLTDAPRKEEPLQMEEPTRSAEVSEESTLATMIYEPARERTINIDDLQQDVPWIMVEENEVYELELEPGGSAPTARVTVERDGDSCTLTVDGEEMLAFGADESFSTASYPLGQLWVDMIFYDLNGDGYLDILPAVSHADRVEWLDGSVVMMRNYSLVWCVYYDGTQFRTAEGRMVAVLDPLHLFGGSPNVIYGDYLSYYKLEDGALVHME